MRYDDAFTETGTALAIVSPCSQCKNQLDATKDGKPFCPRRMWQTSLAQNEANGESDPSIESLAAYGTEGTDAEGDKSLRNPVYLNDGKTVLVWIATLRDNSGIHDTNGNPVVPSILDPSFIPDNTDYIRCRLFPFVPAVHEAAYRQSGAMKEGDQVVATLVQRQQFSATEDEPQDDSTSEATGRTPIKIDGIVNKVNFVQGAPRAQVDYDYNVQGT